MNVEIRHKISAGFNLSDSKMLKVGYKSCNGVNELIKDGKTGILCDDGVEPLAQALDKLMGDKELRVQMGKAAKVDMAQFAPEKIWDQWEELMEKVIREK